MVVYGVPGGYLSVGVIGMVSWLCVSSPASWMQDAVNF